MRIKKKHVKKLKLTQIVQKNQTEFIKNNKLFLKTQHRFKSKRHKVFTEEINKTALSSNDEKRMQSIDLKETYAYGTSKDLLSEKEVTTCNNITKRFKND